MFGILTALTALLCVVSSVISVKVFDLGLLGIAWSNFFPVILVSGILLPIYFNRKMDIAVKDSIKRVWLPALLGSLPTVIMLGIWRYVSAPDSWLKLLLLIPSAIATTALSSWFLSLNKIERTRFCKILHIKKNVKVTE